MSDKALQWSLTVVTILVLLWIVAGIALASLRLFALPVFMIVFTGIVVELVAGIILLHYWGKDYMGRRF